MLAPVRLQTKLTLAFAVALSPIAALAVVARVLVQDQYRAQFRATLDQAEAEVLREYKRLASELEQSTSAFARDADPTIGRLLIALGKGPLDDDQESSLSAAVAEQMVSHRFDVLEIVDERGTLLACGHFPGRIGEAEPAALALARGREGRAALVSDRVVVGGALRSVLALEAALAVGARFSDGPRPKVIVLGGRRA
jgi:hypothetical protein